MQTPLPLLMLAHNKARLAASLCGVAFAALLMLIEVGFLFSVFDSQTHLLTKLNADLLLVNKHKEALYPDRPFPRARSSNLW